MPLDELLELELLELEEELLELDDELDELELLEEPVSLYDQK